MTYIVENNGCYGLTKGQDSATMDTGTVNKKDQNLSTPMDVARLAIEVGATFVGQLLRRQGATCAPHQGGAKPSRLCLAGCDLPCVTFNNHQGSSKSYEHFRR